MTYFGLTHSTLAHHYLNNFYDKTLFVRLSFEDRTKHKRVTSSSLSDRIMAIVRKLDEYTLTASIR